MFNNDLISTGVNLDGFQKQMTDGNLKLICISEASGHVANVHHSMGIKILKCIVEAYIFIFILIFLKHRRVYLMNILWQVKFGMSYD